MVNGPRWTDQQDIAVIQTEPSLGKTDWTGPAVGHPEFSTDGGRTEYVTYVRSIRDFKNEIRMLEIRFAKK